MTKRDYPPRLWALVGYATGGKTTFAAQMRGPKVVIDADHRFDEVLDLAGETLKLSDNPIDNVDTDRIVTCLNQNMPGSNVGTIITDSLTAIIAPLVTQGLMDVETGRVKNRAAANRMKAIRMRQLQDGVTRWGTDVLWIWHLDDGRDGRGNEVKKETISKTELARLTRSINLKLEIVGNNGKRGIKVVWARRGRSGMTLWDESGTWEGMPEKIEQAVYGGLTQEQKDDLETPTVFRSPDAAIDWAVKKHGFESRNAARDEYDRVKKEGQPQDAREMAALWVSYIEDLAEEIKDKDGEDKA